MKVKIHEIHARVMMIGEKILMERNDEDEEATNVRKQHLSNEKEEQNMDKK